MDFPFFEPHGWGKRSADQPQPYYSKVPESASLWSSAFWQAIGIPQTEKQSISIIETLPGWKRNGINHQQGRGSVAPSFFRSRLPSHKQYARIGRNLTADNKILCYIKFFQETVRIQFRLRLIQQKGLSETRGGTIMEDEQILELYFARNEQALAETDRKYGSYCYSLANSILQNQQDAEETVSDTYMKAWNSIPPKRPDIFKMFLAKITRNLAFSRWRQYSAEKRGGGEMCIVLDELEECIPDHGSVEDHLNSKELLKTIRSFLDTLPGREQDIFLRRYFFVEESAVIAKRYDMKPATVLRTLSRTRRKLKTYLTREGYTI